MVDRELDRIIDAALARIQTEMKLAAPYLAQQVSGWMRDLGKGSPQDYFKHPLGFPMLRFPWWLEKTLHASPDTTFQADLIYSTINGYYYIRLIDNLMDGHATVELKLLPALAFFHTQFQAAYQRHFDHRHPFWECYERVWFQSAEATIKDANLEDLDLDQFLQVAAKKTCAATIPVTAVCHKYEHEDLIAPWSQFLDLFGRWHQMWNDVFTWRRDIDNGSRTYFLSEAERRRQSTESVAEWVFRRGFAWGVEVLLAWMAELRSMARGLNSKDLAAYLDQREAMLLAQNEQAAADINSAKKLLDILSEWSWANHTCLL